ncbi:hypothetical protein [Nocardia crassostreae]|uniref:hypothetical protein n=1 Tax=Nocardia crassostreae TaxID=53428 RepID=UPI000833899B|nr:hypothetical protein [Nocardia crassostreae]
MMRAITELEHTVRAVEITELHSTVAAHAAVQVVDSDTLVVVMFHGHHTAIVEQALQNQPLGTKEITSARDIITLRI